MDASRILNELKAERDRIERAISALEVINWAGHRRAGRPPRAIRKRRTFSVATRARMAAAQRARRAKEKRAQSGAPVRKMSQAARKKIAAAQRARWSKIKAQQSQTKAA